MPSRWIVSFLRNEDHCPWLGTCIGYQNRRFFINFLTYLNVGMGMILVLLAQVHPLSRICNISCRYSWCVCFSCCYEYFFGGFYSISLAACTVGQNNPWTLFHRPSVSRIMQFPWEYQNSVRKLQPIPHVPAHLPFPPSARVRMECLVQCRWGNRECSCYRMIFHKRTLS